MDKTILLQRAHHLRKNPSEAERKMWRYLRNRNLQGYKFIRQHRIEPYIVDFICREKYLVIEIDGGQHSMQLSYDAKRTRYLEDRGFKVVRFWNNEVLGNIAGVLDSILTALVEIGPRYKHPSP